ncbi:MAG: histidine kinase [Gammaproteobacteria bacterium]
MVSLKVRLVLMVTAIVMAAMVAGAALIVSHARDAMQAEIRATLQSVHALVSHTLPDPQVLSFAARQTVSAKALDGLRHVRVVPAGSTPHSGRQVLDKVAGVPGWFVRLLAPEIGGLEPIVVAAGTSGTAFLVQADPTDEIREVWRDVHVLLLLGSILLFSVVGLVYAGLAHGLRPLADLHAAFERLEAGNFETRIQERAVVELKRIHQKFNRMAEVLHSTRERERALASHLVDLQEAERRSLAQELHDDMAPLLFTISVHLTSMHSFLQGRKYTAIPEALGASEKTVAELQERIRAMLRRLRPQGLDELGLDQALHDLVETWRSRQRQTEWAIETSGLMDQLDDTLRVTIYRIVQECLTNVARHAGARRASVHVAAAPAHAGTGKPAGAGQVVDIRVEDDGKGMQPETPFGLGLMGIEERVQALGGAMALSQRHLGGLSVRVCVPIHASHSDLAADVSRIASPA